MGTPPTPIIQVKCSIDIALANLCATAPHLRFAPFGRYFRKGCYFGLACFANMPVESELERGARMKSVGILCPSYTLLYRYMHFLENQVRLDTLCIACVPIACAPIIFIFYLSPDNLPSNVSTSCHCSFVPMLSHPLNMNIDPVTAILIHTRFLC